MRRLPTTACRLAVLTVLATACAAPALALDLGGHDRDGVVIGMNLGAGWNRIDMNLEGQDLRTDYKSTFSGGLRVGWARNDYFIASLGIYGWKRSYYQEIVPFTVSDFHFLAEIAGFPRGEGFWIKGGAGGGTFDITITRPAAKTTHKKAGWNYTIGAGYELRISDGAAFGLAYDLRYLTVGDFEFFTDTSTFSQNASLNIHFYM